MGVMGPHSQFVSSGLDYKGLLGGRQIWRFMSQNCRNVLQCRGVKKVQPVVLGEGFYMEIRKWKLESEYVRTEFQPLPGGRRLVCGG